MLTCKEKGIPQRLWSKNPPDKKDFLNGEELLFRWFEPDIQVLADKPLSESVIGKVFKHPIDVSCNRQSFCKKPTDVLYNHETGKHRFHFGIIESTVNEINGYSFDCNFYGRDGKSHNISIKLKLEHSPEKCMYPHTEIECYQNGKRLKFEGEVKPNSFKKAIRYGLASLFKLCHNPDPSFIPIEETVESEEAVIESLTFFQKHINPIWRKFLELRNFILRR